MSCKKWKIQPSFITIQLGILVKDISTYCEGRDQFLVLSVLNPDRDVPRILKQLISSVSRFILTPHQYQVSEAWILIWPNIAGRYRFQVFQTDVLLFNISTIPSKSINIESFPSRYICPHPSKLICSNIAAVLQFLSASWLKEMFYLRQYLSTYFPQEQSYSISSRISPCVYLGSHLLLTSCSTNLGIYTHLNLRQGFKIPISGLFCYK